MPIQLSLQKASLAYQQQLLFTDLNLDLPSQQWVALLGQSGVGKSSLLRMIAGLEMLQSQFQAEIYPANSPIAYLSQRDSLLPWLTVLKNVLLGHQLNPSANQYTKERALNLLQQVGLQEAAGAYPHQLSGGMRQRVVLARTLIQDKEIVLMDEPFSAVDAITRYKLQNLASQLLKDKTVMFITHDPQEALRMANHIYMMQGKPAVLKKIVSLDSPIPRAVNDPLVIEWQEKLLRELI